MIALIPNSLSMGFRICCVYSCTPPSIFKILNEVWVGAHTGLDSHWCPFWDLHYPPIPDLRDKLPRQIYRRGIHAEVCALRQNFTSVTDFHATALRVCVCRLSWLVHRYNTPTFSLDLSKEECLCLLRVVNWNSLCNEERGGQTRFDHFVNNQSCGCDARDDRRSAVPKEVQAVPSGHIHHTRNYCLLLYIITWGSKNLVWNITAVCSDSIEAKWIIWTEYQIPFIWRSELSKVVRSSSLRNLPYNRALNPMPNGDDREWRIIVITTNLTPDRLSKTCLIRSFCLVLKSHGRLRDCLTFCFVCYSPKFHALDEIAPVHRSRSWAKDGAFSISRHGGAQINQAVQAPSSIKRRNLAISNLHFRKRRCLCVFTQVSLPSFSRCSMDGLTRFATHLGWKTGWCCQVVGCMKQWLVFPRWRVEGCVGWWSLADGRRIENLLRNLENCFRTVLAIWIQ